MPSKQNSSHNTFMCSSFDKIDSSPVLLNPPRTDAQKTQISTLSECQSFEGFGENNEVGESNTDNIFAKNVVEISVEPELSPANVTLQHEDCADPSTTQRTSRISRRSGASSGCRQLGSNVLASHLYRSSSFNSSGRSSNCDTTEDMYSDVSLEDVHDLNHKLELLQKQVTSIANSQNNAEDRTTRTKTDYAVLQARFNMLEEQLREVEIRAEENLAAEQKRHRELLARTEREAVLQNENCQIKIKTIEMEANSLREEVQRLRMLCERQAGDLQATEEKLDITRENLSSVQLELTNAIAHERNYERAKQASEELLLELSKEVERLKSDRESVSPTTSPEKVKFEELHQEIDKLRQKNKLLEEQNEELQAMVLSKGIEEGRHLINSLAQELEDMSYSQLQQAFQEKEEENLRLKRYIDTILLNIVENYPQLLEVKISPDKPETQKSETHEKSECKFT